jgi:hypothetical protein
VYFWWFFLFAYSFNQKNTYRMSGENRTKTNAYRKKGPYWTALDEKVLVEILLRHTRGSLWALVPDDEVLWTFILEDINSILTKSFTIDEVSQLQKIGGRPTF